MAGCTISMEWEYGPVEGSIAVRDGRLAGLRIAGAADRNAGGRFTLPAGDGCRLELVVEDVHLDPGPGATIVRVDSAFGAFSFFLRDVLKVGPLFVPDCRAAVTTSDDSRRYDEIAGASTAGRLSGMRRMEEDAEQTYADAAAQGRVMRLPAVLGLGRDARVFHVDADRTAGSWGSIRPGFGHYPRFLTYPHAPDDARFEFSYVLGRGMGCQLELTRRLDDGVLPILHGRGVDGDTTYDVTAFVTLERRDLAAGPVRGTPAMFAAALAAGFAFAPGESERFEQTRAAGAPDEFCADNQTVLMLRAVAVNHADVPRYAFFKTPALVGPRRGRPRIPERYEPETGFLLVTNEEAVGTMTRLDARPMPLAELSVLLPPGGRAVLDIVVPHSPVSRERAQAMARLDFDERLKDCRAYWRAKAATMPEVSLPELHIEERLKAGLLQLDIVTYGRDDEPALSVPAGLCYPPIGSESLPLIFFYNSMGWHDVARRGLMFFLERQRPDGLIQVYAHYMIETGAVLFGLAEHYRYTRDEGWVRQIQPKLIKACDYLLQWRQRNRRPELRGKGYGMLDGAVADERDPTPYFFNSGYACAGLRGAAEMLAVIDPERSAALAAEADAFRDDIRAELAESMAASPVVALEDGTWRSPAPPWAGHVGPLLLFAAARTAYTHHAFITQDSVVGPVWLIFQGILDPGEPMAERLLQTHHELMTVHNTAFCQQYYSRHDYAHLLRGEPHAFLRDYYHSLTLSDPEIYSFWEHYCMNEGGPYKTHEQAWFLMQTRWMLYLEDGDTLRLLAGVPRAWLADGKRIDFADMRSHFGSVSLHLESRLREDVVEAGIVCDSARRPRHVTIRIPHPDGRKPRHVTGGVYLPEQEAVRISPFEGTAHVRVRF